MRPLRNRTRSEAESLTSAPQRSASFSSVSTQIILCVCASTLLTALIVSWLGISAIHRDVHSRLAQHATAILSDRAHHLNRWYAESSAALASAAAPGHAWQPALLARLHALAAQDQHSVVLWQGVDEADASDWNHRTSLVPASLKSRFERLSLHRISAPSRPVARPGCLRITEEILDAEGLPLGHVEGCLSMDAVYAAILPTTRVLPGMRMLITNAQGLVLAGAGMRAEERLGQRLPLNTLVRPAENRFAHYRDDHGTELVGRTALVGPAGWLLVTEAEYVVAFAPAIAIARRIFVVGIGILLVFSAFAYKITQAILQPIHALSDGARRIADGQLDYEIPVPARDDELGLLVRTFNGMMRRLRHSRIEIERDHMRLAEKNEELQQANEVLAQLSITDGLTKLHNHRYFQDHLTREIKRVSRTGAPLAMILLDIDDFKQLNDKYGHAQGDEALVRLAAIMNDSARESDLIARYGGEEFVILLPNTDLAGAVHLAEKIRMAVESTTLEIGTNHAVTTVTVSVGVATFRGNRRKFFSEADKALYAAKAAGKNCVIIAGAEEGALA
jgi:diguanylate cyclase (GGDEF)-like protein